MRSPKTLAILTTIAALSIIACGCDNDEKNELNPMINGLLQKEWNEEPSTYFDNADEKGVLEYIQKSNYSKDLQALDAVKTAIATYVVNPNSVFENKKIYTLKELIDLDTDNIIAPVLEYVFIENYENGDGVLEFDASSDVFEGITTDDVNVLIDNGVISILAPVNEEWEDVFDPYIAGVYKWPEDKKVKQ